MNSEGQPQICQLCHEPISDTLINCRKCQKPYHDTCAKISHSQETWTCPSCKSRPTYSSRSSSSTHSSCASKDSLNSRRALELKRLEEEHELTIRRDKEYLSKKYKILQQLQEEAMEDESPTVHNRVSESRDNTANVPNSRENDILCPTTNLTSINTRSSSHVPVTSNNFPLMSTAVCNSPNNLHDTTNINRANPFPFIYPNFPLHSTTHQNYSQTHFGNTNNVSTAQQQQQQSFTSAGQTGMSQPYPEHPSLTGRRLTADQLHARQTVPKELPLFSGCPEEWPLFSSTYDWSTAVCGLTDAENLIRLQRALRGEALEAVKRILVHPSCVPHAISTLRVLYGQPEKILFSLKNKIKLLPQVNPNKMETITNFAIHVKGLQSTIEACGLVDELNNSSLLQELISKLPPYYQINWGTQKLYLQQNGKKANLIEFSAWMFDIGLSASTVNVENHMITESSSIRKQKNLFIHTQTETKRKKCHVCSGECNNVANCIKFVAADRKDRWNFVKQLELCKHCLKKHHGVCYNKNKSCNVEGCQMKHHHLLHGSKSCVKTAKETDGEKSNEKEKEKEDNVRNLNTHNSYKQHILFKIVPIRIFGENNKVISTFAFLDDGSSISLIDEDIVKQLDLKGEAEQLCLKWTANVERVESNSQQLNIQVCGSNNKQFSLNVCSVKELALPKQTLEYESLCRKYSYLKGLPIQSYTSAVPKVLIGLNNVNMTICSKIREGGVKEPIAIKTALGWTVFGPCGSSQLTPYSMHICECTETDNKIHQLVKQFYNIESLGINYQRLQVNKGDERSLRLLNDFTKQRTDGHYETSLLWQFDKITLPDNYEMAKKRLICLENKLLKNRELFTIFAKTIENYSAKGYISKIDVSNISHKVWYLPIFPVFNKNKPGKCRIVWDAAAKFHGVSLNSMLHKGPDLLTSLPAILFKFREKAVAICGDIEQMFHQIYIREEDRHVQRFLWRNCDTNREPDVYIMNVMIFGASCAPCISQYVKNTNASKFEIQLPQAADAVKNNHYVDDFLFSTDTIEQAVQIAKETHYIQSQAGFNLRNWCSNKIEVVERLEIQQQETERQLNVGSNIETEKVLGVFWNPTKDTIIFKISPHIMSNDMVCGKTYATKRQVLKILMTIYDPLGLIGNFLMFLKIILQEIWKSGVSWDEPIKDEQLGKWKKWLQYLPDLEKINIQRCYLKSIATYNDVNIQLHTFVDASENGYAAVAYLRIEWKNRIVCSLVGSKTRVAPLRMVSIPRLELMAALIGCRFANNIIQNHSILVNKKYFWSDSRTVISWLTHNNKKYHQFVALRISEILETTELEEWHWIPGRQNVADEATKWAKRPDVSENSRWLKGPDFLLKPVCEWPKDDTVSEPLDIEINAYVQLHTKDEMLIDVNRFSKWTRLLRTSAYVLRFLHILKQNSNSVGEFTSEELLGAEFLLFRLAQKEFYVEEINILKANKQLSKSSPLYKMSPKLDENYVLRIDGRLDKAYLPNDTKYPVVLPRGSRITFLLIMHFHVKYHHLNNETVVNEIRQRYYIPRLRVMLKTAVKQCQTCKIRKATPDYPQMAKLPEARLAAFCSPFTYTGLDYFGPILVTVGRHTEKRYGALFTCLTVRAVHIEVVNTLNTSSCILAIRNFMCRRGTPREFYSDNGTNFVSAEKEIREALKEVDKHELVRNFTTTTTKWNFNPPSSPHMGGAWERLVRSVKTVFYNITPTRVPGEELLRGMLTEVENIINSRPLTYVPIDNENAEALTPNHLLLGSSNGMKPLAMYDDSGVILKHNWLCSQQYAERFWRRWLREYLPSLTFRSKWHEKTKPLQVDDLVIVVDPSSPRNVWPRGKVLETSKAKDGQVRSAKILTSTGILVRPAARLAILDVACK